YPSQSEADLALCCMLALRTGKDAARIDSLFRQSGLIRDKWYREDYRERTLAAALANTGNIYQPAPRYASRQESSPENAVNSVATPQSCQSHYETSPLQVSSGRYLPDVPNVSAPHYGERRRRRA